LIAQKLLAVSPSVIAALLLVARSLCEALKIPAPSVAQILTATGASHSAAYALMPTLSDLLPTLVRPRGRPPKPAPPNTDESASAAAALTREVLSYVMRHPGCVEKGAQRQHYSDRFRHFILELQTRHAALDLDRFAAACALPLGTIKDWLRAPTAPTTKPPPPPDSEPSQCEPAHLQTVLDAWSRWHGSFRSFCDHVREQLLIPFGRNLIEQILFVHQVRRPTQRKGRRPDELALRGAFATYFPGAQWVGDGMYLPVSIDDQRFAFNLELNVDSHSGAFVGTSIRDAEDSAAVTEAFADGVATTGAAPLALLLDNRPSNHTSEVQSALGDTLKIRATVERPQNKAHVEGAFGLFSRVLPELSLDTTKGPHELARALALLVVLVWARAMNHRPRLDRGGRSRVELYSDKPTPEQVAQARQALRDLATKQELARRTLAQRRNPDLLALLQESFERLGLLDPDSHVRLAIAGYPLDDIVAGLAIFEAKLRAKTLPDGADARYLLGIVRNIAQKREGELTAQALLRLRLDLRDRMLAPLVSERDALLRDGDLARLTTDCIDRALQTSSPLCRLFWLDSLAARLALCPLPDRKDLFRAAARRINATFAIPHPERSDALRILAEQLFPCT
jgi:hypothetical protein